MRLGIQKNDSDSSPGPSLDGSFRKPGSATSVRSTSSTSSKIVPASKRAYRVLKEYSAKLIDLNLFTECLEEWVAEKLHYKDTYDGHHFNTPFSTDELRTLDYALEGVLFQQLLRMPYPSCASENLREDEYSALEDFIYTAAEGLWRAFWHKNKPMPCFVSCPLYPRSKFYTIEKAASRGRLMQLSGAALMSKNTVNSHARWDDVVQFVLFKKNAVQGKENVFSPSVICEALLYAVHLLFYRGLSKHSTVTTECVFVSVLDSKFGGVLKLGGDLGKLEVDLNNPYQSITEWITDHAEIGISLVDQIWNKLGNVNWGDLGSLQILLAMFYSMIPWIGPPRKSVASLAANHSLRLQKRRLETRIASSDHDIVPYQEEDGNNNHHGEIIELEYQNSNNTHISLRKGPRLDLSPGETVVLEDQNGGPQRFLIHEFLNNGDNCSYIAVSEDCPSQLLTLHVGAHTSCLEPSWEDMNLWYQVQRQTKVLNLFKEHGVSSKHLPEIIASGRIVHPGPCEKQSPKGRCEHPWCGTPILVTCPVGETLASITSHDGPLSPEEATRCCRDCLAALRSAKTANILHGDIRPENIIRINGAVITANSSIYVLVSWGRAVLEDRDSPLLNLQFSSAHTLQHGKLCPSSDVESLVYLIYFASGGSMPQLDSIESALRWRAKCWSKRIIQQNLGEVSPILKAFADYVDSICGTPYAVDYDVWVDRLNRVVDCSVERGKNMVREEALMIKDVAESSGGGSSLS